MFSNAVLCSMKINLVFISAEATLLYNQGHGSLICPNYILNFFWMRTPYNPRCFVANPILNTLTVS